MALFNNTKKAQIVIGCFIILFLGFLSCEAKAGTTFEVGATVLSNEFSGGEVLILSERFGRKWNMGIGLIGDQKDKYDRFIRNNLLAFGQRTVYWRDFNLGFGLSYIGHETTVNGSKVNFMLSAGYDWNRFHVVFRHMSNAGSTPPNAGQDMILIGYSF